MLECMRPHIGMKLKMYSMHASRVVHKYISITLFNKSEFIWKKIKFKDPIKTTFIVNDTTETKFDLHKWVCINCVIMYGLTT